MVRVVSYSYSLHMRPEKAGNNLVNRLFKNSNAKQRTPSLASPAQPHPSSQTYLVPKITKPKLKPLEPDKRLRSKIFSQQDLSFDLPKSDSRALPTDLTARSPPPSKLRSKIYSMIEEGDNEEKPFLTPQDFMDILRIDREMSDEFCYLNRRSDAYDWQIVEFEKKDPKEYMVISRRGLTRYLQGEVEFLRFEQFLEEQRVFKRLQNIDYFRLYTRKKYFQTWKKFTSTLIFRERSKEFSQETLLGDPQLRDTLAESKRITQKLEAIETFYCQAIAAMPLAEFHLYAETQRRNTAERIAAVQQALLATIRERAQSSMALYMKRMRISQERAGLAERKIPLLIGDQTGKQMPYTKEATIRTHQERIRRLLKTVDYLLVTSKTQLLSGMADTLTTTLRDITNNYMQEKKGFASSSWLILELHEQEGFLLFSPEQPVFLEELEDVIMGTLAEVCGRHAQLLHLPEFQQYWKCKIEGERTDEFIDLRKIVEGNPQFNERLADFRCQAKNAFSLARNYAAVFQPSLAFLQHMRELESIDFAQKDVEFFKDVMARCRAETAHLAELQVLKEIGVIALSSSEYRQRIEKYSEELTNRIHQNVPSVLQARAQQLLTDIKEQYELVAYNPMTIKDYITFLRNCQLVTTFCDNAGPLIADNSALLTLAEAYSIKVGDPVRNLIGEANGQMIGLSRRLGEIEKAAPDLAEKFKKEIEKLVPTFKERIKVQAQRLAEAELLKGNEELSKKLKKVEQLAAALNTIVAQKDQLRGYQQDLGLTVSEFEEVDAYQANFRNIQNLYNEKKGWADFSEKAWKQLTALVDFPTARKYLDALLKRLTVLTRELQPNEVLQGLRSQVEAFRPVFLAVEAARHPSLEEKHLDQMRRLLKEKAAGRDFVKQPGELDNLFKDWSCPYYNFEFFRDIGCDQVREEFVGIAIQAEKQAELVEMLVRVQGIWKSLTITTTTFKDAKDGTILGNNDELITKIDDNLMVVNNILASKYVGPIRARVELQGRMLRYMQELIDEWYVHQKNWLYLEPILRSPFALKNLPKETGLFAQLDAKWKVLMKQAKDSLNVKRYADEQHGHFTLRLLKANNDIFQLIQKTLENFLEKKRDLFQRFYFLSNDELLEILSTVKTPEQAQPHLRKVFQNFVKIRFDDKGIPTYMVSAEGQEVQLRNCIFRGEVEEWFRAAEESMRGSLKSVVRQGLLRFGQEGMKRVNWLRLFPSQVVLVCDCILWTSITEGYLQNSEESDLSEWLTTNIGQLAELVELIRSDLSSLERKTLVALITQDVHYRDILQNLQGCESPNDFRWQQQLRFYSINENVLARQVQSELAYGYEYLGATSRLVITPLTDRCWITITGALHIKLGANPAGPAGTGKTQSCKDLAKSLGRYCIVFNCSDQINATMMQKLFAGLAYTGSWTCLDEFNRIDIEVLSVIAQQVLTIREALLIGRHNKQLILGGKTIHLNHDLGIFITMNPGYAGRTQLPDNLKTLFRPVAMMVPDYTLIAEIMLFSQGFTSAKELSRKMTKLYKLSSEQLSQQDHYDFGMRAVKSVLVMAGGLKRAEPDVPEDIILIRAMQDSNIPKFLAHDLPLFNGIIEDLFPSVRLPKRNQQEMINKLQQKCEALKVSATAGFIEKSLQLHQTLKVRFGVMLVGPAMGGKTTILQALLDTFPVVINPKAVSLAELYGNFDPLTLSWTDGLAAKLLRQSAATDQYVLFDGPVDAVWVENLNTVLDDSMMLCLSNGERIKLSPRSRVLFEVLDLNQASPATVSRCGMVWVSQQVVDWEEMLLKYFQRNPVLSRPEQLAHLTGLMRYSLRKGLIFLRKFAKEVLKLNAATLTHSYCKFVHAISSLLTEDALAGDLWKKAIEKLAVFAYVWSVGSIISEDSRPRFDKSLSQSFSPQSLKSPIHNFSLSFKDKPEGQWISWTMCMPQFEFPEQATFLQVFVPTRETFCFGWIAQTLASKLFPVFLSAPTGAGKTSILSQLLRTSQQAYLTFTLTAQTSPGVTQLQLQGKLQALRRQGAITLVPPPGKQFFYLVDDINMPAAEQYGAQPPLEMLRLLLGHKGVWDRRTLTYKLVQGVCLLACGTTGRADLPPRLLRFFNSLYLPEPEEDSLVLIFGELSKGFFQKYKLKSEVNELIASRSLVQATLSLYAQLRAELLPTPAKPHYLFNLRDVSRVFQGLALARPAVLSSPQALVRLWVHQFQRVFEDRMTCVEDRQLLRGELAKRVNVTLKSNLGSDALFESPIHFCSFLKRGEDKKDLVYQQAKDYARLVKIVGDCMSDDTSLNLVLFADAVGHVVRVSRSLQFEKGHILLVGLSGSGKQAAVTLGAAVSGCKLMQVEVRRNYGRLEFREDLFRIMKTAAFDNQQVCFLFPDSHMTDDAFLEDTNNLLSSGQVPCMLTKDAQEEVSQNGGPELFLRRVLTNLHLAITLTPTSASFRARLRNFPSLVNCCSIDWVSQWPAEALRSVAAFKLQDKSVGQGCVWAHGAVEQLSTRFLLATRRKVYVTARNYVLLIETFNHLLTVQRAQLQSTIAKLGNGVHKLTEANAIIEQLQVKLTKMKPVLESKTIEQQQLLKKLEVDRRQAGAVKQVVEEEEKAILQKTEKALQEKREADRILSEALPALHAANEALNTLNRNDISEIKMNQNPHAQVKFTLQCVSVLLQEKQDWQNVRKTISDVNFISRLKGLDVYHIPNKVQTILRNKLKGNPNFKPAEIKQINFAAKSFCEWVLAVLSFHEVNKEIVKKKEVVKRLNEELDIANKQLQGKRDELSAIITKVKELETLFLRSKDEKETLDKEILLTRTRLSNAEQLTVGLKNQKVRWDQSLKNLAIQRTTLVGNIFQSACCVAYAGPFSGKFRQEFVTALGTKTAEFGLVATEGFKLGEVLGDSLQIAEWINCGLPKDDTSVQNGILVNRTLQNPMMVDPQLQASKWMRNHLRKQELSQLKTGSDGLMKQLETALRLKRPILLQTSQITIDPAIEPLLARDYSNVNGRLFVRLGENRIQVDPDYKVYVFTKLANPAFSPQVFIKLAVVNFTVTREGLEDQLLAEVVGSEIPEVESKKRELVVGISKGRLTLARNQDSILALLSNSKGFILDDTQLIANLAESKKVSTEVNASLEQSVVRSVQIETARAVYQPVAERGALLYLAVSQLAAIQNMYQFSLQYYSRIFRGVLAGKGEGDRVLWLKDALTRTLYANISRALFNPHKRIFAFVLATRITGVPKLQYDYFTRGSFALPKAPPQNHKAMGGLSAQALGFLHELKRVFPNSLIDIFGKEKDKLTAFNEDPIQYCRNQAMFKDTPLSHFQKLLLVRALRPQLTNQAISEFVRSTLGVFFVDSSSPSMLELYADTSSALPLTFILSPGADPLQGLLRLARQLGKKPQDVSAISLGQGQGPVALRAMQIAGKDGRWVVLQNCHLGKSFLPTLQKRVQQLGQGMQVHPDYRLFLTVMPCDYFPPAVLQNSLKVTSEPPRGLRANLKKLIGLGNFEGSDENRTLAFNLCLFHALVLQRRKFGSLGWNILYDFNESDLETALTVVAALLAAHDELPLDAIDYFVAEIIYGGRVTDDFDRRLLRTQLQDFISLESIEKPKVKAGGLQDYLAFAQALPAYDQPGIFGLNENAQKTYLIKLSVETMASILQLQPQVVSSGAEGQTAALLADLLTRLPAPIKRSEEKKVLDALDVCLLQESVRFNKLLAAVQRDLKELQLATKGEALFTEALQNCLLSLTANQVPREWQKRAYPSLKPLASWYLDLLERVKFMRQAVTEKPKLYWLPAFFFPQGFLTAVLQIHARKTKLPVDSLSFSFLFRQTAQKQSGQAAPSDGCLVYGLFSEACSVQPRTGSLKQSPAGVLDCQVPVIHFKPVPTAKNQIAFAHYQCPLYKTKKRAGTLSTTGHSTNFVVAIVTRSEGDPSHWVKRGAAFFCSLEK